jgi:hypothetical protein
LLDEQADEHGAVGRWQVDISLVWRNNVTAILCQYNSRFGEHIVGSADQVLSRQNVVQITKLGDHITKSAWVNIGASIYLWYFTHESRTG